MSEKFKLDRETNIKGRVDAMGRKWVIHRKRETGLCYIRPVPDREDAVIPDLMEGLWTTPDLLNDRLDRYLKLNWDEAERKSAQSARTAAYAKEHPEAVLVPIDAIPTTPERYAAEQLENEGGATVPDVAADMTSAEKEAVIQRAVDAENAAIALAKE